MGFVSRFFSWIADEDWGELMSLFCFRATVHKILAIAVLTRSWFQVALRLLFLNSSLGRTISMLLNNKMEHPRVMISQFPHTNSVFSLSNVLIDSLCQLCSVCVTVYRVSLINVVLLSNGTKYCRYINIEIQSVLLLSEFTPEKN